MVTIQILTHNNGKTLRQTLESLLPLQGTIMITDLGSTDDTIQIAKSFNAFVTSSTSTNRSNIRNKLITQGWNFYIDPWEVLINLFTMPEQPQAFVFQVINNNVIIKETRLWHSDLNLKFENPIYESLYNFNSDFIENSIIFSNGQSEVTEDALDEWVKNCPTLCSPYYYRAFLYLKNKKYNKFINDVNQYLFLGGDGISSCTIQYYMSLVYLYVLNDVENSTKRIAMCLNANILMAEFWCVLGDIFYKLNKYEKAYSFYENAIILGSRRLKLDFWPMDIDKYKTYPKKMMQSCQDLISGWI